MDAKRGKLFTRIIRELVVAARMGGGDPSTNPRLRVALLAAKDANMPKDTIDRNVKKGAGELEGVSFEDITYEGYGPGGVAFLVECSTDNKNRTAATIRHLFSKYNGSLGTAGCVAYLFDKKAIVRVKADGADEDKLMETALEAGAEDVANEEEAFVVTAGPGDMMAVREALEAKGFIIESAELQNIPSTSVQVEGKEAEGVLKLMSALEDEEDTMSVSANFEMDDSVIENFNG